MRKFQYYETFESKADVFYYSRSQESLSQNTVLSTVCDQNKRIIKLPFNDICEDQDGLRFAIRAQR